MKKIGIPFIILFFVCILTAKAQNDSTYYFYDILLGDQNNVSLFAKNIVSKQDYAKLACVIDNRSKNYVVVFGDKCAFLFGDKALIPLKTESGKVVAPFKKDLFTIETKNQMNYLVREFAFKAAGVFTFNPEGSVAETEDFHLPVKQNQYSFGNFNVVLKNLKKETDETIVKFSCTYTGDKIAVISPSNPILKTIDGKEWATYNSDIKPIVLQKGETMSMTMVWKIPGDVVDMQKAEMDIVWKNTFVESDMTELVFTPKTITINKEKTTEKNKKE